MAILVLTASLTAMVAQAQAAAEIPSGGTLRVATIGEPPNLDIQMVPSDLVSMIAQHIFEQLFAFDAKYEIRPMLAESYQISPDGRTYTIQLRRGVRFHNGKEMTSEDVVASLSRWGRVASRGRIAFQYIDRVEAQGPYTVVLHLRQPFAPLLAFLAFQNTAAAIYPKSVVERFGDQPISEYVGTGPYRFEEWRRDYRIRLVRFEQYAARSDEPSGFAGSKVGYLDAIEFYPVPEAGSRLAGILTGDYDYAIQITKESYPEVQRNPNVKAFTIQPGQWGWVIFNKKQGLMANQTLRQAAQAALDMQPILAAAYGLPTFYRLEPSYYPPGTPWYSKAGAHYYNQKNRALARELMGRAGYRGEPIRLIATTEYDYIYKIATVVAAQWQQAGFNVDLQIYDWATLLDRRSKPDAYDAFVTGHAFVPDPSLITIFGSEYPGWWDSPEKNRLLQAFNSEMDHARRLELWNQLQELIYEEVPAIRVGEEVLFDIGTARLVNMWASPWPNFWNVGLQR
ncbi:ABC transporter substrate-binding protein [Geochorda subterranea]|uniref:ABC transporter substrate-binding protein n=1 Tax=Geochorda subterranea TaxID=3109564 RepID=A0ABZ1BNU7_9FIRM|nr:ABC transporter substrate-binding protein [Limnochorda sp. LNt]WRP14472.1 ABC transporter substrate-binding protein [Limnochorda sp. LNt]